MRHFASPIGQSIFFLCLPLFSSCGSDSAGVPTLPQGPPIRIIIKDLSKTDLENPIEISVGDRLGVYSLSGQPVLLKELDDSPCSIQVESGKIVVGGVPFGSPVRLAAMGGTTFKLRIDSDSADGDEYRGVLDLFYYADDGWLRLVNELGLEEYLAGVVGREMAGERFSLEVLKAQAITARTYTLYHLKKVLDSLESYEFMPPDFAFPATTMFQSYGGVDYETPRVLQAIRETKGHVLTYHGKLFQSYYHSACGGHTASGELFGDQAIRPLGGVACGYCENSPNLSWRQTFSRAELEDVLSPWLQARGVQLGELTNVVGVDHYQGQHCAYVKVVHSGGSFEMRTDHFRSLIARHDVYRGYSHKGADRIPGSRFTVTVDESNSEFTFEGVGRGHGVGLCQNGAAELANSRSAGQILSYYFPESGYKKVY